MNHKRWAMNFWRFLPLLVIVLPAGCDYARMTNDEAVNTYQAVMPDMDDRTVSVGAADLPPAGVEPRDLVNPLPVAAESVEQGRVGYGYYCLPCHGPRGDGRGTVGQSFAPLPTDLGSEAVLQQSDGELFHKITAGFKRHPPLGYTVAVEDRWAVIIYLRNRASRVDPAIDISAASVIPPISHAR